MTSRLRQPFALATLLIAVAYSAGCGNDADQDTSSVATRGVNGSFRDSASRRTDSLPIVQHLSRSQRQNFAPLRTPPERLPKSVMATLRRPTYGANWSFAQRLNTGAKTRVWALPANGAICLIDEQSSGAVGVTCTPVSTALRHGITSASLDGGTSGLSYARRFVVGLVPDNVPKVRIETPGFGSATVRVAQNTFALRDSVSEPPESIELLQVR